MPLRRYHTPSLVRQTSSASILPPLVSTITGLPPCSVAVPGPLVDIGSVVARVCDDAVAGAIEGFGDGEGDGDGDTLAEGDGSVVSTSSGEAAGAGIFVVSVAADVVLRWLKP